MRDFEFHSPATLEEASALLTEYGDDGRLLAGGTGLVQLMKQRLSQPAHLISLRRIPGLDQIHNEADGLHIGALCSHQSVFTSPLVQEHCPLLVETYGHVATPRIRNMATVGGGLAHADPNQDPPISLLALDAMVNVASGNGEHTMPLDGFFVDYYETILDPGEIIKEVIIPPALPDLATTFIKFLPRTADDYATVSVAVAIELSRDNKSFYDTRIVLGSVGPTPMRIHLAEAFLNGQPIQEKRLRSASRAVWDAVDPVDDFRGSAEYKRDMAALFTYRALNKALGIEPDEA